MVLRTTAALKASCSDAECSILQSFASLLAEGGVGEDASAPESGAKMSQCGAKMSQDAPKMEPRRAIVAPRSANVTPGCANVPPRWAKMSPRAHQGGAKVSQEAQMWLPCRRELDIESPKAPKGGPRGRVGRMLTWTTGGMAKPHFGKNMSFPCRRELHPTIWPKRTQRKV